MRRVLVTGGTGFVGRHAVAALRARGFEIHALGRRASEGAHVFHGADLLDQGQRHAAVRAAGASHLLHLAWVTEPGRYWHAPQNLDWTAASLDLVRVFREAGGTRAVVAGTCAEYDWTGLEPLAPPDPGFVPPSPRMRGEGRDDRRTRVHPSSALGYPSRASPTWGVGATSGSGGEGAVPGEALPASPPHPRLPARFGDGKVAEALSPHAGRGDPRTAPRTSQPGCDGRFSESAPCRAATLYGSAKDGLRRILASYAATAGLSLAWGRLFYLYGPGEAPGRLVGDAARALLAGSRLAASEGHQRRDFLHVGDAGAAFAALLDSSVDGPVNIGSGAALPVRAILDRIGALTGGAGLIDYGARPLGPTEPACIEADIRRLTEEVGFRPRFDLDEGLRATVEAQRAALNRSASGP